MPIALVIGVYARLFQVTRKDLKAKKALASKTPEGQHVDEDSEDSTGGVYLGPTR